MNYQIRKKTTPARWLVIISSLLAAMLLAVIFLSACSPSTPARSKEGAKEKSDKEKGTLRLKTERGTVVTTEKKLPDGFPKDVKIYPGARLAGSLTAGTKEGRRYIVSIETTASYESIDRFYAGDMRRRGWREIGRFEGEAGGAKVASFKYGKGARAATVSVNSVQGKKSSITLTVFSK